jgi:hypothetical protein
MEIASVKKIFGAMPVRKPCHGQKKETNLLLFLPSN